MMKRRHVSGDSFTSIIIRYEAFIPGPRKMNDLQRTPAQQGQRFDDGLVNAACALTPSHHQHRSDIGLQSEFLPGRLPIQAFELGPNRRAGELSSDFGKESGAFFEAEP